MAAQHEYEAHALVRELSVTLGADRGDIGPEKYVESLMKQRGSYNPDQISNHHSKKAIAEFSTTPVEFTAKYEDLKLKNVRDVDAVTYITAEIVKDESVHSHLKSHAVKKADKAGVSLSTHTLPKSSSKTTREVSAVDLSQLKKSLRQQSEHPAALMSSDMLKQITGNPKREANISIPLQPSWVFERPHLNGGVVQESNKLGESRKSRGVPVGKLPEAYQEKVVMEQLLACLLGHSGEIIQLTQDADKQMTFTLDQTLQPSHRDHVQRILPLCSAYATITQFIRDKSSFENGLVNQALVEGLDKFCTKFTTLVCQLETKFLQGQLTLSHLWFYLQPTISHFSLLESICSSINKGNNFGANTLSLLHNRLKILTGDAQCSSLCVELGERAAVPYLHMLELWLYRGIIQDPYAEFMVSEDASVSKERLIEQYNDTYWEKRYTLCRERIPVYMEMYSDEILSTGKYLNVVRLCGQLIRHPNAREISYNSQDTGYRESIESAYSYASQLLLDLFYQQYHLKDRFRSFKRFFLLDQGDFIVQFMDMTNEELKKPISRISEQKLESLLELAIRTSTANCDPYKDDIRVSLLGHDLITQLLTILSLESTYEKDVKQINPTDLNLSGLEAFSFSCTVQWPLSLVFNKKVLFRYQMLFRHLFYMKHVERLLNAVWVNNSTAKGYTRQQLHQFSSAFLLRHKMLNFIQHLQYYMMIEVIDSYWTEFETSLKDVSNVDEVLNQHMNMLNKCLRDCMLTNPELLKTLSKLQSVCILYCNFMQRTYHSADVDQELSGLTLTSSLQAVPTITVQQKKNKQAMVAQHVSDMALDDSFYKTIANFDKNFTETLMQLLNAISELNAETKLLHILDRVNYNDFYSS
ncbi:TUBGCP2 [Bugula neritina]|uniref:Gamma-tubulin complex component n=1 Tax=Bugula neritina TaxID=10212 RepID=A0A7J7J6I9_BUGNE|nr:TUBGCP2 [Bugula neritina]